MQMVLPGAHVCRHWLSSMQFGSFEHTAAWLQQFRVTHGSHAVEKTSCPQSVPAPLTWQVEPQFICKQEIRAL
jgi:hypothetical protein